MDEKILDVRIVKKYKIFIIEKLIETVVSENEHGDTIMDRKWVRHGEYVSYKMESALKYGKNILNTYKKLNEHPFEFYDLEGNKIDKDIFLDN